jgi:TRAP-type C4-dicarboxylate transport system permease small subunit
MAASRLTNPAKPSMRRVLDAMYQICTGLAATFLVLIALLIGSAIVGRWFGILVPSADDIAGYCMAASAFLGLAPTLRAGGHIRVSVLLGALGRRSSRIVESIAVLAGIALVAMLVYNTALQNITAYLNGEMSTGIVPIPIWLPQLGMTFGMIMMLVALIDELVGVVKGRDASKHGDPELAAALQQLNEPQQSRASAAAGDK